MAPTLILVLVMAEALLIARGTYAGAVALAVIALARRHLRGATDAKGIKRSTREIG